MSGAPNPTIGQVEAFAHAIVFETVNMSSVVRKIIPRLYKVKDETVWNYASLWKSHPRVVQRVEELTSELKARNNFTIDKHLSRLAHLGDEAIKLGQVSAAVTAEKSRGQVAGFYVERFIDETKRVQADEIIKLMAHGDPFVEKACQLLFDGKVEAFKRHCLEHPAQLAGEKGDIPLIEHEKSE